MAFLPSQFVHTLYQDVVRGHRYDYAAVQGSACEPYRVGVTLAALIAYPNDEGGDIPALTPLTTCWTPTRPWWTS